MIMRRRFHRFPALAAILAACLVLAACGFQPLYGTRVDGSSASRDLASVSVAEQPTRLGQLIRNELLSTIAPAGQQGADRYVLELRPQAAEEVSIRDFDTGVLRRSFRIEVAFRLSETGINGELYSGRSFSQASYDRTGTPFSDMQARITAEERAAKEVGADIATRLAAFFASR
jgi:LPS-assembly lipoprotein